jgi:tRNA threonylcarbamoyl adenosine modification protein YeaZ
MTSRISASSDLRSVMRLLLDTALDVGSVALFDEGHCVQFESLPTRQDHGAHLAEVVSRHLVGIARPISAYGLIDGPGSFTGLRIGLSFLNGLCAARPAPVYPVSTLRLLGWQALLDGSQDGSVVALVPASRGQFFAGMFTQISAGVRSDSRLEEGLYDAEFLTTNARSSGWQFVLPEATAPATCDRWSGIDLRFARLDARTLGQFLHAEVGGLAPIPIEKVELRYLQRSAAEENLPKV